MKERPFHQSARQTPRFAVGPLLTLLLVVVFSAIAPHSTAQVPQDNRQLNREQTQQANRASERRIALVIGNGAYTNAPPLKNPPNDARDMAATLKELGFEVASGININQREMKALIRDFGQKLKTGGAGLFYYAGHGVQSKGRNYLIPVEADIQSEAEVEDAGVDVNLVLNYMDDAQNSLNIVILDACRNNPFGRSFRSASNGLAQVDAPTGTLIAYATAPGRVASDGTGQNGLYTAALLKQMRVPGLSVTETFMHVRAEVMKQTANKQVPWEASSLVGAFYFSAPPKDGASPPVNAAANETKIDPVAVEREYWETIRNSTNRQDYQDYLANYPNGAYAAIAKSKLRQLGEQQLDAGNAIGDPSNTAAKSEHNGRFGSVPATNTNAAKPEDSFGSTPGRQPATDPNNKESRAPTMSVTIKAFKIELQSCKTSGGDVTCELTVTNTTAGDKEFALCQSDFRVTRRGKDTTKATDNMGSQYEPSESIIGSSRARKGNFLRVILPRQAPVKMALGFENIASGSTIFTLLRIAIYEQGNGHPELIAYADFRNVVIEK
jgi:hypothetical protein